MESGREKVVSVEVKVTWNVILRPKVYFKITIIQNSFKCHVLSIVQILLSTVCTYVEKAHLDIHYHLQLRVSFKIHLNQYDVYKNCTCYIQKLTTVFNYSV